MPSLFKKLTIFFVGAALVGGSAVAVGATTASAAAPFYTATHAVGLTFAGGAGHSGSVWAGTWNNGMSGFCLDFGKSTPNRSSTSVFTGNVPGMNAEESKQAKYVANKYDHNGSPDAAANAGFAIWRIQHDSAFNVWYGWARSHGVVSAARHNAINAILADALQHGPYKMTVSTDEVYVGQRGNGTVKLLGSNGKPAVDRWVTVTSAQARILTVNGVAGVKGPTRSTGLVFTYQRNTTGRIEFQATHNSDSPTTAGISVSSPGHQRTLSGVGTERVADSSFYDKKVPAPAVTVACDTDCDGQSTVTFRFANPSGIQAIKWIERVGSVVVATLNVKPGTTNKVTARITDGKVITTSSYCYTGSVLGGGCTTPTTVLQTPYQIVCPAWAQAVIKVPCNCQPNLPASVTLTSPAGSPRFYRGFVRVNKGAAISRDLVNGKPTTITTAKLGKDSNVVVSFTVYRDAARTIPIASYVLDDVTVY